MVYTVDGSGAVTVDATVDATGTSLGRYIRIGTVMELPEGYENVEKISQRLEDIATPYPECSIRTWIHRIPVP